MNIPDVIKLLGSTTDEEEIRSLENNIARMFISPLLFIASIVSFACRFFFLHESIWPIIIDSIVLICAATALELISRKYKNESRKEAFIIVLFSFIIVYFRVRFYYLVGVAVWIVAMIILMVTIIRTKKTMTLTITFIIIALFIYSLIMNNHAGSMGQLQNIGQIVMFTVLLINLLFIRQVIVVRHRLLSKQFDSTLKAEEKLRTTLKSVGDGVIAVDERGVIEFINPIAERLTGWRNDQAIGESFDDVFNIINEYTRQKVESPVGLVLKKKQIIELANHTILISKDGKEKPIEDTAAPIKDKDDEMIGCILVFRDFSEKKEKQKRIEYLSYHDQLTGLFNRRFFEEEIKRLDVQRNLPMSFVYADVNGLKIINDAFGHDTGDKLIQKVAEVLKAKCRADDIIARIGGDEFVILLPQTDATAAENLVTRIMKEFASKEIANTYISVSFGWDTKHEENQLAADILKNAEDNMYQKKIFNSGCKRNGIIRAIHNTLLLKNPREERHSKRVSDMCKQIGQAYGLKEDEITELCTAGELHDIGKIAVDEKILNKSGKLSKSEQAQIMRHPETGYRLLSTDKELSRIAEYIFAHHERWDGTGYPKGLQGEAICWQARAITIADAYDAMTSERPYRAALSFEQAMEEIKKNAGTQFDPELAKVFIEKVLGAVW